MKHIAQLIHFTRSSAFRVMILVTALALFVIAAGAPNATIGIGK